jgi:hypothetical protein
VARRWLALGPIHVQPAEMAKLGLVLWLSYSLSKKADKIRTFLIGFVPHLIMAGFLMFLCLKQPDFGSAVVLLFLTFTMLFVAGAKLGYLLGGSIAGAALGIGLIFSRSYRVARYLAWLDMDRHRQDVAYQPFQSVMSFGSGAPRPRARARLQVLYCGSAHDFMPPSSKSSDSSACSGSSSYLVIVAAAWRCAPRRLQLPRSASPPCSACRRSNLAVAMAIFPPVLTLPFVSYGGSLLVNGGAGRILLRRRLRPGADIDSRKETGTVAGRGLVTVVLAGGGRAGMSYGRGRDARARRGDVSSWDRAVWGARSRPGRARRSTSFPFKVGVRGAAGAVAALLPWGARLKRERRRRARWAVTPRPGGLAARFRHSPGTARTKPRFLATAPRPFAGAPTAFPESRKIPAERRVLRGSPCAKFAQAYAPQKARSRARSHGSRAALSTSRPGAIARSRDSRPVRVHQAGRTGRRVRRYDSWACRSSQVCRSPTTCEGARSADRGARLAIVGATPAGWRRNRRHREGRVASDCDGR